MLAAAAAEVLDFLAPLGYQRAVVVVVVVVPVVDVLVPVAVVVAAVVVVVVEEAQDLLVPLGYRVVLVMVVVERINGLRDIQLQVPNPLSRAISPVSISHPSSGGPAKMIVDAIYIFPN